MKIKGIKWDSPGAIVISIVGIALLIKGAIIGFPLVVNYTTELAGLSGFVFSDFFADEGLIGLALSGAIVVAALSYIGIKSGKR